MPVKTTEFELEKRVRTLERCKIRKIWYQQMENGTENHRFNDFHSVDTAIYFTTENNRIFKIFWADDFGLFHGFGISVKEIVVINRDEGVFTELTTDESWQNSIGKEISTVRTHWQNVIDNMPDGRLPFMGMGYIRRADYPQTLEIILECGIQIFISVLRITDNNQCIPFTNHLSIFFSKAKIDQYYKPLRKL